MIGQGIVSANIQRRTPFAIRIRPAPCADDKKACEADKDKLGHVEVQIHPAEAVFKYRKPVGPIERGPKTEV